MNDLVKSVVYLTRIEDQPEVEDRIQDYYRRYAPRLIEEPPAETLVCVPGLHEPDLLVEIDSIAVLQDSTSTLEGEPPAGKGGDLLGDLETAKGQDKEPT